MYENEKVTKTDSQLPIDPDPQGSLIGLRLKIDYPNLQSTVFMKTHNNIFNPQDKNIQFYDSSLVIFHQREGIKSLFCDVKEFKDFLLAC